eukprot:NODE_1368_length_1765_cov_89.506090_g1299_i0.p1 GENE.NODE_1368_length_1765_cov_89.506090_g1299_i0~~NODE_1368_length_1765_cov_89.506090_g1299_i0.p1  ORF type:complete len:295 (+),score=42.68 NODE_1368_length_1765_cov_89.506090_g1299_i0:213-1097(+)
MTHTTDSPPPIAIPCSKPFYSPCESPQWSGTGVTLSTPNCLSPKSYHAGPSAFDFGTPISRYRAPVGLMETPVRFGHCPESMLRDWKVAIEDLLVNRSKPIHEEDDHPAQVLDFLYLGSQQHVKNTTLMEDLGITHILNCAEKDCESTEHLYPNMQYWSLDAEDTETYRILEVMWEDTFEKIEQARQKQGKIFIHCKAGINRSATLCIAYLIAHSRLPLLQAIQHTFCRRPFILHNHNFKEELIRFARQHGHLRANAPQACPFVGLQAPCIPLVCACATVFAPDAQPVNDVHPA